jgi:hypothetical protein
MVDRKNTWRRGELAVLRKLRHPAAIQSFIDSFAYNTDKITRSPRGVIGTGRAHCFDGAMFAAAAIEYHGGKPWLIDLRANDEDDDHILAIFSRNGLYGSIGQSNYTGGRYRDPVFRTIRELVMSYFCVYFNLAGRKTLREFSGIFDLRKVRDIDWRFTTADLSMLGDRIDSIRHYRCIPSKSERELAIADSRTFKAETLFLDKKGAFKVKGSLL